MPYQRIHMEKSHHLAYSQGASLVSAENGHAAHCLDGGEILYEDAAFNHAFRYDGQR
jgi:hypothetical protein